MRDPRPCLGSAGPRACRPETEARAVRRPAEPAPQTFRNSEGNATNGAFARILSASDVPACLPRRLRRPRHGGGATHRHHMLASEIRAETKSRLDLNHPLPPLPVRITKLPFVELAVRVARHGGDEVDGARALVLREPRRAELEQLRRERGARRRVGR